MLRTTSPAGRALRRFAGTTVLVLALAACGADGDRAAPAAAETPAATPAQPATAALAPDLQAVYDRSCKNCHSLPATGAPQTGDAAAWAPRVAKGQEVLLDHTLNGFQAMPPLGTCMDCSEEQFRALIAYMVQARQGS